jgi:hypothetical protein
VPWGDLRGKGFKDSGFKVYCCSKLMLLMASAELHACLAPSGTACFAAHPGFIRTPLYPKTFKGYPLAVLLSASSLIVGQTPVRGSISTLQAAAGFKTTYDESTGACLDDFRYFGPGVLNLRHTQQRSLAAGSFYDPEGRKRLLEDTLAELQAMGVLAAADAASLAQVVPR